MKTIYARGWARTIIAALFLLSAAAALAQSGPGVANEVTRWSVTTQMTRAARDRGEAGKTSQDEYPALGGKDALAIDKTSRAQTKSSARASRSPNMDFWFYTADVVLFNDNDADGYYHGIDLLFDADTIYDFAEVYAVVYLSLEGGAWEEYAETEVFSISGTSADDEYVVVSELVSGYPTGSYDLLIELFDTFDDSFVASYGPADTSELAFLQLEDSVRDTAGGTTIIVDERGGGSTGLLMLLPLLIAAFRVHSSGSRERGVTGKTGPGTDSIADCVGQAGAAYGGKNRVDL